MLTLTIADEMAEQQGSRRPQQQPQTLVSSDQPSTSGQSRISSMQQTLQTPPQQSQHILMPVIKNAIDELTTVIKAEVRSVQTEQAKFSKMMKKLSDDSFSIENSPFKVREVRGVGGRGRGGIWLNVTKTEQIIRTLNLCAD